MTVRNEHRQQIARDAATKHFATIAREYGISVATVIKICREQGASYIKLRPWQRKKEKAS